ncbi:MAG: DMT family transporter [Actinobacteria bacterium]|nr:DMT family transporter [Actinomycetota bacterium]
MNNNRRLAVVALAAAGTLWGTTVPLSKVALAWLPPGWLTVARFALAAAVLLVVTRRNARRTASRTPVPGRTSLRPAGTLKVLASGAIGYGGSVVLQNAGVAKTSVTHAALLIGAVPVLVAVIAAVWQRAVARPVAWLGFGVSLAGVGLVTGGHGGGASTVGDGLVLLSVLVSSTFTVAQNRLLRDRDPMAVTAVQFLGAALAALVYSVVAEGLPPVPATAGPVLATVALTACGTLVPFTLFAYGQSRISAEAAGAFLNLEPLVGALAGVVAFGDPVGPLQAAGGAAIVIGIALSSLPLLSLRSGRGDGAPDRQAGTASPARPAAPARTWLGRHLGGPARLGGVARLGRATRRGPLAGRRAQHRPVLGLPGAAGPDGGRVADRRRARALPGADAHPAAGHAPYGVRHHARRGGADPGRLRAGGRGPRTAQGRRLAGRRRDRGGPGGGGRLAGRGRTGGAAGPGRSR